MKKDGLVYPSVTWQFNGVDIDVLRRGLVDLSEILILV